MPTETGPVSLAATTRYFCSGVSDRNTVLLSALPPGEDTAAPPRPPAPVRDTADALTPATSTFWSNFIVRTALPRLSLGYSSSIAGGALSDVVASAARWSPSSGQHDKSTNVFVARNMYGPPAAATASLASDAVSPMRTRPSPNGMNSFKARFTTRDPEASLTRAPLNRVDAGR